MPERGTVVVFKKFHNQLTDGELDPENALVVKRVLALPGERVVVKGTDLLVYNEDHPDGFMPDNNSSWSSVIASTTPRNVDITLKEGELFVAGDDRENSVDSRDYGPINISQIQGAVLYRHKGKLSPYQVMHE
jgi:signal peptidase I